MNFNNILLFLFVLILGGCKSYVNPWERQLTTDGSIVLINKNEVPVLTIKILQHPNLGGYSIRQVSELLESKIEKFKIKPIIDLRSNYLLYSTEIEKSSSSTNFQHFHVNTTIYQVVRVVGLDVLSCSMEGNENQLKEFVEELKKVCFIHTEN